MVFDTEKVKELQEKMESCEKLTRTQNIFYLNDKDLKRKNVKFTYSNNEMIEYAKCFSSKEYFIESNFNVKLMDFQKNIIKHYDKNRFIIFAKSMQIGFTNIMSWIYLWELIFNPDFTITYIDNKMKNMIEMIDKIKNNYKKLPFFLKPGVERWDLKHVCFDNKNRFICDTAADVAFGYETTILHVNDLSLMTKRKIELIYGSYVPLVSSAPNKKMIISSFFTGENFFYDLYKGSLKKGPMSNMFETMRIPYSVIQGRDEVWKKQQIELFGGGDIGETLFEERFNVKVNSKRKRKIMRMIKNNFK